MPITFGHSIPDRLAEAPKRPSWVPILVLILVLLIIGAIIWLGVQSGSKIDNRAPYSYAHIPISIIGNAGFTTANGVIAGQGTASDPYIIADWDLYAEGAHGISISHTDAHFTIRNCSVHDSLHDIATYDGIYLLNCTNGTLENNICKDDFCGIFLNSSRNNTLVNNDCSSNLQYGIGLNSSDDNTLSKNTCNSIHHGRGIGDGIYLVSSRNNTLSTNICNGDSNTGISLVSSGNNTLSNNTCLYNEYSGIHLISSSNNTLSNNSCSNRYGICLDSSSDNTLADNNCSSEVDDGIRLWSSNDNMLISNTCNSNGYVGISLGGSLSSFSSSSSNYNTLIGNNCSWNVWYGMYLWSANNNTMSSNKCSHDSVGIQLDWPSTNNKIFWNLVSDDASYGVSISSGSGNRIWDNAFIGNNGTTGVYDASCAQAYDDGAHNYWNNTEGFGNYWSDWTTPDVNPPHMIVDLPYNIPGIAGAKDYYPLAYNPLRILPIC